MYADAATELVGAAGDHLIAIEHIGSTAVPGMPAKPIIDLLAAVTTWDHFDEIRSALEELGYVYTPESELDDADRRVFRRGPADMAELRTHQLHVTEAGSDYWKRIIAFRDQLRDDPTDAAAYADLKRQLAVTFESDSRGYTDAKTEFVQAVERKRLG